MATVHLLGGELDARHFSEVKTSDGTDVTFSTSADADANADVGFSHPRMRMRMSAMGSMKIKLFIKNVKLCNLNIILNILL